MVAKSVMRLAVLLSLLATVSQAQVVSNFNSGADGWTCIEQGGTTVTPAYSAAGGNPGGYLSQDIVTTSLPNSNLWFWLAPAKFLGNRSLSYNQTLSFDLQQSQSGTDVSIFGDVVLTNTADGYTLYYPLPTKPATASWSSYTIALNETAGWKKGNLSGPAPTKDEMKRTLVNLSSLKIRAKYMGVVTGSYIAKLDNVVLQVATLGIAPVITSFTPRNGLPGTTVTITGSNFHTTIAQNSVYFSGVKATVTAATATQLTVNVPAGAPQGPITVVNTGTGLQAISTLHFYSRFDNNKDYGGRIIPSTMSIANQTVLPMSNSSNNFGGLAMGDFDQDGREDLVTTETATKKVYIYRSLGTMPVAPSSFATPVTLPGQVDGEVVTADFDGDGLLDIAGLYQGASFEYFNVFRNTSSPGSISFAAPVAVQLPNYTAAVIHADDLDGDGRIDLIATNGSSGSYIWVNQNLSSPGNIDFAGSILLGTPSAYSHIATGDIDNDGKKEMIVSYYSSNQFLVFPNASIPGTISMGPSFTITPSVATISDARLILADLDNDAKTDLAWAGYSATSLFVKKNQYSSGTLDATAFGADLTYTSSIAHPTHLASADINSDGLNDIVVVGFSDMAIYQNTGSGSLNVNSFLPGVLFEGAAGGDAIYATGPCIADFDGDNKPEVIMGYTNPSIATASKAIFIYRNESFPPPQITSLSSTAGNANTSFKIVGNYLNTYGDIPDSRVEGLRGALSAVSNTSATASAIAGNSDRHVGVTLHGLSAFAQQSFTTTFSSSGVLDNTTFPASVDFALSSSVAGDAMAIADYDNDNKPDVLIDDNITGKIFRNTQTTAGSAVTATTLTALTNTLTYVYHGKPADLDGDGWIDLVVNGSIYKNNSGTQAQPISFAAPVYFAGNSVNRLFPNHDLNLDGKPEVVYSTGNKVGISENFTRNNIPFSSSTFPSFTMSPVTINAGGTVTDLAITDFDGDGFEDIAMGVAGGAPTLAVMRNNGLKQNITASQFAAAVTFSSGNDPQYMAVADFDGDGKNDIAVGNNSSAFVTVYRNTSTSGIINFQRTDIPAPAGTVGIVADDLDGDGKAEIVIINQVSLAGSFSLFQNKSISGTISFGSAITYSLPNVPYALATADMNLDGKADILVARTGSPKAVLSVFENKISNASVITVTTPPASTTVCEGTGASLSTAASGTTNIVYQWQVYDKNAGGYIDVNDDATYSGYATGKLSMNTRGINGVISFRCKISGDLAPTIYTNVVTVTVNIVPPAPVTTSAQTCKAASVILQASGGTNGQYRWYTSATAVTPIAGQTQSAYSTPVVNATTTYFVAINNGLCESTRTNVDAVVNPVTLAKPAITTQPALIRNTITVCDGTTTTLTAPAGFLYQWSDNETSQAINVTASGSYSVVVSDAQGCISPSSDAINVVINPCDNPPAISASTVSVALEGKVIVDLTPLVSDPDNNIDLSSLKIVQPPASGAIASINADHQLIIDYTGIAFSGEETILVEVCDLTNRCAQQQISIDVAGDIVVYGGISPNGDDKNAIFFIQFIDVLADTKNNHVTIYNRWGDAVFDTYNYDNVEHVFRGQNNSGADLSAGTYFYKIEFASGKKTHTGYLSLKR
ncbi:MAG TPA: FG-GAP-like repeat-containing protein [Ohtaekwangia sp.]|uniref:FG-GAP-like repeat-containing protein n=1 Tax=Ohtaekwangia sp. TaxID=2066019 RepID=UPI002F937E7C